MKTNPPSFPFFLLLLLLAGIGTPVSGRAQEQDSTYHYYHAILNPHQPEDIPEGIRFYTRKKETTLAEGDTLKALEALRMLAIGQFKIGDVYASEASMTEALALIDTLSYRDTLVQARAGIYNQLGRSYRFLQNTDAALQAFGEALSITTQDEDRITILNNIANVYKDRKAFAPALDQYREAYRLSLKGGDSLAQAMALDNLGGILSELQHPAAPDSLRKALAIRQRAGDLSGLYASHKNLALHQARRGDTATALIHARQAQALARQLNSASFRYDALELLALLHNDPDIAEYRRLTDSLARARQLAENKNAFIQYNLGEERKKTAEQALQKERAQRSKQLFQLSTAGILLLLILSYFLFRYRYKKGRQEEMYRTESRISKKVHDELANDLFHALAFAEAHPLQEPEEKEKLLTSLDRLYARTRDISKDTAPIPTGPEFPNYLREILAGFSTDTVHVILTGLESLPWARISDLKKMACFRILQELLVNMKKHSDATLVVLSFTREGKFIRIQYSDNGRGIAPGKPIERGGLRIAENRMAAIKGTFTFENQASGGFRCQLRFPL